MTRHERRASGEASGAAYDAMRVMVIECDGWADCLDDAPDPPARRRDQRVDVEPHK